MKTLVESVCSKIKAPGWGPLRVRRISKASVLLAASLLLVVSHSGASAIPYRSSFMEEPERFDSEYYLDLLTMRFDRDWRDLWDGTDNAFRLRFGSLNVEQWNLQESLKFSARISRSFRVRYWMERYHALCEQAGERNEIEVELNACGYLYLSLLVEPAFWKRENDIGIGLQHRRAIDRYVRFIVRVRDFANNFAYRHGDNIEGEENLFTRQPVEAVVEAREKAGSSFRFGVFGSVTNRWEREYRFIEQPQQDYIESRFVRDASCWLEYDLCRSLRMDIDLRTAVFFLDRRFAGAREEKHRVREFLPRLWWYPVSSPRLAMCAGIQLRRERWSGLGEVTGSFRKDEFLPFLLIQTRLSARQMIEIGYLADRYKSEREGFDRGNDTRWENRVKLAWEIRLRGASRLRVIETVDLDREDWGQFSVHDHFFVMMFLGF